MELNDDADFSDDEVFFGKMTLKEVKKRVLMGIPQKIFFSPCDDKSINEFKLIDRSSQPNMHFKSYTDRLFVEQLKSTSDPHFNRNREVVIQSKKADDLPMPQNRDSFLEMEKYIIGQSSDSKSNDLDNTLELVDFILNHGQIHKKEEEDVRDACVNKQEVGDYKYFHCDMKVTKDEILSQSARQNEGQLLNKQQVDDYNKDYKCDIKVTKDEILSQSARQYEGELLNKQQVDDYNKDFKCEMKVTKDEILSQSARQNEGELLNKQQFDDYNKDFKCAMKVTKDEILSQSARQNEGQLLNKQQVEDYKKDFKCDMKVTKDEILSRSGTQNEGELLNKQQVDDYNKDFKCDMKVTKDEILSRSARHNEGEIYKGHTTNAAKLLQDIASTATLNTPTKCEQVEYKALSTPNNIKKPEVISYLNTPKNIEKFPCIFKTPKGSQLNLKSKAYKHIASPIATYIRQSPQVPLVKEVHPKKPLPTTSSSLIPKLVKNIPDNKINDKENIVLPQLAYRSAKKTILINVDKEKLPQGNWAHKLPTPSQKPVVLKHQHRKIGRKPLISQQDSFADLSLHQADVSICTEKLAFTKLKKTASE